MRRCEPVRWRRWRAGGWRLAGTLPGLLFLLVAWQAIASIWGPFVLPSPASTIRALVKMSVDGRLARAAMETAIAVLLGFSGGVGVGVMLGIACGLSRAMLRATAPAVTLILGVPPIAWVVLALLWFGSSAGGAALTAGLTVFPMIFAATVEGVRTTDPAFLLMARAFGAGLTTTFIEVRMAPLLSHLLPALATAQGIAWKAVVMAEVMGAGDGLGGALALARANLDLGGAMAVIVAIAVLLVVIDAVVLRPLHRYQERWRRPG